MIKDLPEGPQAEAKRQAYQRYAEARQKLMMRDADVARLIGVSRTYFSDWKSGKTSPSLPKLKKIAEIVKLSPDYLLGLTGDQQKPDSLSDKSSVPAAVEEEIYSMNEKQVDEAANAESPYIRMLLAAALNASDHDIAMVTDILLRLSEGSGRRQA